MASLFGKKRQGPSGIFLSVMQGFFRQKSDEHTEGAEKRENKNGEDVWELLHETVIGHVENVYIRENRKYGNELHIVVHNRDVKIKAIITIPVSSSYTRKFLMVAGNLDFNAPIEFSPFHFPDRKKKDKFVTGWNMFQHGSDTQVAEFLSREEVPEIEEKTTVKGTTYDDTDAIEYMWKKFQKIAEKNNFKAPEKKSDDEDEDQDHREEPSPAPGRRQQHHHDDEEDEGYVEPRDRKPAAQNRPDF